MPSLLFTVNVNEPSKSRTKSLRSIEKRKQRMKNCMVTNKRLHYEMELEDAEIIGIHKLVCKRVEAGMGPGGDGDAELVRLTDGEVEGADVLSNETSSHDDHQLMEQGSSGDALRDGGGSLATLRESLMAASADPSQARFLTSAGPFGLFRRHELSKAEPDVIEFHVTDPVAMYRQLQDLDERLEQVEGAVADLLPQLEPIFDKFKIEYIDRCVTW